MTDWMRGLVVGLRLMWRRVALWLCCIGCAWWGGGCQTAMRAVAPAASGDSARMATMRYVVLPQQADQTELVEELRERVAGESLRWLAMRAYPHPRPLAIVALVHGLGTNGRLWDLPGSARLARELWRAGYWVYSIDLLGAGDAWQPGPFAPVEDGVPTQRLDLPSQLSEHVAPLTWALQAIARHHGEMPLFGVGLDIGGMLLYRVASDQPRFLSGVVAIGTPLTFAGCTRAFTTLLQMPRRLAETSITWNRLRAQRLPPWFAGGRSFEGLLLSRALPSQVRHVFYTLATSPMPRSLLESLEGRCLERTVPHVHYRFPAQHHEPSDALVGALAASPSLPILAVVAPGDGLAPPWQSDPAVFGLRGPNIARHYVTRANGSSREYNHLDLVLHPQARRDVFPAITDWLRVRVRVHEAQQRHVPSARRRRGEYASGARLAD